MIRLPSHLRCLVFARCLEQSVRSGRFPLLKASGSSASTSLRNPTFTPPQFRDHQRTYATVHTEDSGKLFTLTDTGKPPAVSRDEAPHPHIRRTKSQDPKPQSLRSALASGQGRKAKDGPQRRARSSARKQVEESARAEETGPPLRSYDESHVHDVAFILAHQPIPTKEMYPNAQKDVFDPARVSSAVHTASAQIGETLQAEVEFTTRTDLSPDIKSRLPGGLNGVTRCSLKVEIPNVCVETAFGEGQNKQLAKQAAWLDLVSRMHTAGTLKLLFPSFEEESIVPVARPDVQQQIYKPMKLDQQMLEEERDAKIDIYNYAAANGLIPTFHVQTVQPPRPKVRRGRMASSKALVQVVIRLPEQSIEVSATGKNLHNAEVAAAINFKRSAEEYRTRQVLPASASPGAYGLSTDTAKKFFDFMKIARPRSNLEIEYEGQAVLGRNVTVARVSLNGEQIGEPAAMPTKRQAEDVAWLTAAVQITSAEPHLLHDFQQAMLKGKGNILRPVMSLDLPVDSKTLSVMRDALLEARRAGLADAKEVLTPTEVQEESRRRIRRVLTPTQLDRISKNLATDFEAYLQDPRLEALRVKKQSLPMNQYRDEVLKMINENLYSIVVGATGSGKTTQVPQILFDEAITRGKGANCDIICTQPRRIAATSVAQRVAVERNEKLRETIGYQVRFDKKLAEPGGSITYCTTGILLEQLKHGADEIFDSISHLVIDEVHERDLNVDFLMIILKKAIRARQEAGKSVPRVVLMSATLDTELFARYFNQSDKPGELTPCPSITVPGRTFPVKEKFLGEILREIEIAYGGQHRVLLDADRKCKQYLDSESTFSASNRSALDGNAGTESVIDWKRQRQPTEDSPTSGAQEQIEGLVPVPLVAATLAHICKTSNEGAILAFLPGLDEILKTQDVLRDQRVFGVDFMDSTKFKICLLHSTVSKESQADVFEPVPPGCRKIILSTNIAETSVTIPDVQYVVDTGKLREKRYDQIRRITKLQCTWVSKSNSKQRAGRAGRVQNGNYYALFTRERYETLRAIGLPELLRSDLQETCLSIKAQRFDEPVASFLAQAIEPPAPRAATAAVDNLMALEAFTQSEELTALGQLLAKLPVHPTLGKMIVLGVIFRCLDPLLILGAAAEERSLFVQPFDKRAAAREAHRSYGAGQQSDHITLLNAFRELRSIREEQGMDRASRRAGERFLHMGAFRSIENTANQIHDILIDAGLIPHTSYRERKHFEYGHPDLNRNADNLALVRGLVLAGYHPNLSVKTGKGIVFRTPTEHSVLMHPSSVNKVPDKQEQHPSGSLFAYSTLARSNDGGTLFMRDSTLANPLTCTLFGGKLRMTDYNRLEMDEWLPFFVKAEDRQMATKLILEFRKAMDRILSNAFQSLSSLQAEDGGYLADDNVRELFARGLVEVLNQDVQTDAQVAWLKSSRPSPRPPAPWLGRTARQARATFA